MNSSKEILTDEVCQKPCGNRSKGPKKQQILVGWNRQKSIMLVVLMVLLVGWAAIFFPLKDTYDL